MVGRDLADDDGDDHAKARIQPRTGRGYGCDCVDQLNEGAIWGDFNGSRHLKGLLTLSEHLTPRAP